eukprot:910492-Amphidinium_carterae.1
MSQDSRGPQVKVLRNFKELTEQKLINHHHVHHPIEVISHQDMINNVMVDLEENHIITIHSLMVNEDKNEKAIQLSTSDVILQDWHPAVTEVNLEKFKNAMLHELNQINEYTVFTEANVKSLNPFLKKGI